jgi:hypothetical protein
MNEPTVEWVASESHIKISWDELPPSANQSDEIIEAYTVTFRNRYGEYVELTECDGSDDVAGLTNTVFATRTCTITMLEAKNELLLQPDDFVFARVRAES